jgi:hypothetical protein
MMDPDDERRLTRAKEWMKKNYDLENKSLVYIIELPEFLVAFENYLLKHEAERMAHG